MKRIAINGFGRIGRLIFRELIKDSSVEIVAINDLTNTKTLAHLLKYDTAHGKFAGKISFNDENLIVDNHTIKVTSEREPKDLPWEKFEIDVVVEATGFFTSKEAATNHLIAGAKKVVISAPAKGDIKTIVFSVNHKILSADDKIISAASCTTNALAPVAHILHENFKVVRGFMTTIHAYTGDQGIQDKPHSDLRRARAGAVNFVPTTTGAAIAVGKVLPELNGKLDGIAIRGPVITGSLVDLVVEFEDHSLTANDINAVMKKSVSPTLGFTEDPIVSSDIIGDSHGSIFDAGMTKELVVGNKKLFKVLSWYDNESSYVAQFIRTFKYFINL